jgi:hypothetical protein
MNDPLFGVYENRLIVLLENDEYDGFRQVMLDDVQFKKISDAIFLESKKDASLKEGYELGTINIDDERVIPKELFEGMNSINNP